LVLLRATQGNKTWRWVGTTHLTVGAHVVTNKVVPDLRCKAACPLRLYRIHLPTYNTVGDDFSIGLDDGSQFKPDDSLIQEGGGSILWYGSSILQGAVASRPGQIATHIVSRALRQLVYNFGFSGSCWMEPSVAQYLAAVTPQA